MEEKFLPKVQILFAVIFGLIVLFSPFVIRSLEGILLLAATVGFGLGLVTVRLGWVILLQNKTAIYPFREWSLPLLKQIYGAQIVRSLEQKQRTVSPSRQRWLGIASLVGGGFVIAIIVGLIVFALS
ncbi:MAG: hypothetical protein IH586_12015 [Anaerolineaceae bacterium]|nr:hypothetical protein [Anaerolineaceae bacterium]